MGALSLLPTLMPTWPGPQHGRHTPSSLLSSPTQPCLIQPMHPPSTGLILATPTLPPPMERSTSWKGGGLGILHLQNPPPWTWATSHLLRGVGGGGILTAEMGALGFLSAHHLPSRYPQTTGNNPRNSFFNFPPQHIINKPLQL